MISTYRQAFALYLDLQPEIEGYLLARTHDPDAAGEISRRVMERMTKSCCNGREIRNERAWVRAIARNVTADYYQERRGLATNDGNHADKVFSEAGDPYAEVEKFLRPLIGFLPEKYAEPLRLDLFEKVPQREIAERLGLGLSATKSRIQRARKLLRAEIETCFQLEAGPAGRGLISVCLRESCRPLREFQKSMEDDASF